MDSLKQIVFGLIMVSAVITGVLQYQGAVLDKYTDSNDIDMAPLRRMATISNSTYESVEGNFSETIEKVGSENIVESLYYTGKSVFTGLVVMVSAIPAMVSITTEAFTYNIMPAWFASMLTAIITIGILFILITIILKWKYGVTEK